jgi:hypothetical protein
VRGGEGGGSLARARHPFACAHLPAPPHLRQHAPTQQRIRHWAVPPRVLSHTVAHTRGAGNDCCVYHDRGKSAPRTPPPSVAMLHTRCCRSAQVRLPEVVQARTAGGLRQGESAVHVHLLLALDLSLCGRACCMARVGSPLAYMCARLYLQE